MHFVMPCWHGPVPFSFSSRRPQLIPYLSVYHLSFPAAPLSYSIVPPTNGSFHAVYHSFSIIMLRIDALCFSLPQVRE